MYAKISAGERIITMKLNYDPSKIGEYEIKWWIAHNDKDKESLKKYLALQNMELYGVDEATAGRMTVFLFTAVKCHDTRDWTGAVAQMVEFYDLVKQQSGLQFDSHQVAELEVGWWELHDKLEHNPDKTELAVAFAKLYGTIFAFPGEEFIDGGNVRAMATHEHDLAEDPETLPQDVIGHWEKAKQHLITFYAMLKTKVN